MGETEAQQTRYPELVSLVIALEGSRTEAQGPPFYIDLSGLLDFKRQQPQAANYDALEKEVLTLDLGIQETKRTPGAPAQTTAAHAGAALQIEQSLQKNFEPFLAGEYQRAMVELSTLKTQLSKQAGQLAAPKQAVPGIPAEAPMVLPQPAVAIPQPAPQPPRPSPLSILKRAPKAQPPPAAPVQEQQPTAPQPQRTPPQSIFKRAPKAPPQAVAQPPAPEPQKQRPPLLGILKKAPGAREPHVSPAAQPPAPTLQPQYAAIPVEILPTAKEVPPPKPPKMVLGESVLVTLPMADQINDLEGIIEGMHEGQFDRERITIIRAELKALSGQVRKEESIRANSTTTDVYVLSLQQMRKAKLLEALNLINV